MTPAEARTLILHVFVDRKEVTVDILQAMRRVQTSREEYESEALFRVAGIPYPGPDEIKAHPESIRLLISAARAAEMMGETP